MDTIIYLYHTKEDDFVTEKWQGREYCLIRFGIPAFLWQNLKSWEKSLEERENLLGAGEQPKKLGKRKPKPKRKPRKRVQQQEEQEWWHPLLDKVREQQIALCLLGDNPHWTYCVYEDFLWDKIDTKLWRDSWRIPLFQDYHDSIWLEELARFAVWDCWLIIGYAPCIAPFLYKRAARLRSVRWILKAEQYTQDVQELLDEFDEEYGLVIEIQQLEPGEEWVRVRPHASVPVNVLDFSGEEKISACDIVKESVWLDMDSLGGKERRMEMRSPQISYISIKKQWANLDTIGKNRYNT